MESVKNESKRIDGLTGTNKLQKRKERNLSQASSNWNEEKWTKSVQAFTRTPDFAICRTWASLVNNLAILPNDAPKNMAKAIPTKNPVWEITLFVKFHVFKQLSTWEIYQELL